MPLTLIQLRRSLAELLAYSVCDLFPNALLIEGDSSDIGFHYDFYFTPALDEQALALIEQKMQTLAKQDLPIKSLEMMRKNAISLFQHKGQSLKAELLLLETDNVVPVFQLGNFYDFAPGPYISNANESIPFKLYHIEQIDTEFPSLGEVSLTRIHGVAFTDKYDLKKSLKRALAAKDSNHQVLGREMQLFIQDCNQNWTWLPKGVQLREKLLDWWNKEHRQPKYQHIITQTELDHTHECAKIFTMQSRSVFELPLRFVEWIKHEDNSRIDQLNGLLRPNSFSEDLTHIFCSSEQLFEELISSLQFINKTIKIFGIEHHWYLRICEQKKSKSKEKQNGHEAESDGDVAKMIAALETCGCEYSIDKLTKTHYGPEWKVQAEVYFLDAKGQGWRGASVSIIGESLSQRLHLNYLDIDGHCQTPVIVKQSGFGPLERLIAILTEQCAGQFPLWLAPEQVRVVPVSNKLAEHGKAVQAKIQASGFRCGIDYRLGGLGEKIHAAERERVPYVVIIGDKELRSGLITVRSCVKGTIRTELSLDFFLNELEEEQEKNKQQE